MPPTILISKKEVTFITYTGNTGEKQARTGSVETATYCWYDLRKQVHFKLNP